MPAVSVTATRCLDAVTVRTFLLTVYREDMLTGQPVSLASTIEDRFPPPLGMKRVALSYVKMAGKATFDGDRVRSYPGLGDGEFNPTVVAADLVELAVTIIYA